MEDSSEDRLAVENQSWPVNSLSPPAKFEESDEPNEAADRLENWLSTFERYRIASGLRKESDEKQVSALLYTMGDCANAIVKTLNIDEKTTSYEEVKTAVRGYFEARRNTIFARARFNRRKQNRGESVNSFIEDLQRLANNCQFGTHKEELIRDRIVVGVLDDTLSHRLQAKPDLTLAVAADMSREAEAEARKRDRAVIGEKATQTNKQRTSRNKKHTRSRSHESTRSTKSPPPFRATDFCYWCGEQKHDRGKCPAKDATCGYCKKIGHFKSVCRTRMAYRRQQISG